LQALDRALALEGVEIGERRRAGERVAGEGVAVEEGALVLRRSSGLAVALLPTLRGCVASGLRVAARFTG